MKGALSEIGLLRLWQVVERPLETLPTGRSNVADDIAKDVPNGGSEQRQYDDYDYGHQNKDQRILNQALPLFLRCVKQCTHHLSVSILPCFCSKAPKL